MAIVIKSDQKCPHSEVCPFHNETINFCHGTIQRPNDFICGFVNERGEFVSTNEMRSMFDFTGKMIPILE